MVRENPTQVEKKTYVKPQVTEVRLIAAEAVLGFCKSGIGGFSICQPDDPLCGNDSPRS